MKVKDLILLLAQHPLEKEVFIQQGEEYDYMRAYSVKEKTLIDADSVDNNFETDAVVIEYN
jgi:hypothetical protein